MAFAAIVFSSCEKENLRANFFSNTQQKSAQPVPVTASIMPSSTVKYGAMICAPDAATSLSFQYDVAAKLGVSCLRARTYVPSTMPVSILNGNYNVLLNFNTELKGGPASFVSDLNQYRKDLQSILNTFAVKPVVAIIENEETNLKYYNGTAEDYLKQLAVAIEVMHANGIKVANGGITDQGLNYLVYKDYLEKGMTAQAEDYKRRTKVTPNSPKTQDRGAFIQTLLDAFRTMDIDYVNFHWKGKSPDARDLSEVIAFLKQETGKTIINNELGQHDTDPNTLLTHVQQATDSGLEYIVWYSPNEEHGKRSTSLQHNDATLTANGYAYQDYLK